ncbi:MAG TPA: FAD-dependent monooxygenase [Burkholderiaceae bacterium]|nr:FAD-dependent monooxygenase [Burkholderiaceae bacterium]
MVATRGSDTAAAQRRKDLSDAACGKTVVVVGTGVVGLSTALGCAQRGLQVKLVGPVPRSAAAQTASGAAYDTRIYALSQGARGLLEAQKVWSQIDRKRICSVERMRVFGDEGGELHFDAHSAGVERLATICEESQLLQVLWLGCSMAPGIEHFSQDFDGVTLQGGVAHVRLVNGPPIDCALLLGADGKRSSVRAAAGIGARVRSYGHTAFVANFACERAHHGTAYQWFTDEGIVALLPLPGDLVSLVWSAPHALASEFSASSEQDFAERVARRSGYTLGALQPLGGKQAFALDRVVVDRLVRPNVALLGDAAHVVHPLAGQGLNLGLQDVSEFLRLLVAREPWRGLGDEVWLRRYERARAEPIALMRGTVGGLAWLFATQDTMTRRVRNIGMSAVNALAPVKTALIRHALG